MKNVAQQEFALREGSDNNLKAFCSQQNYTQKYQMISVTTAGKPVDWPKDSQKYDIYTNEE